MPAPGILPPDLLDAAKFFVQSFKVEYPTTPELWGFKPGILKPKPEDIMYAANNWKPMIDTPAPMMTWGGANMSGFTLADVSSGTGTTWFDTIAPGAAAEYVFTDDDMLPSEVLAAAIDYLQDDAHWCQGSLTNDVDGGDMKVCAVGALRGALFGFEEGWSKRDWMRSLPMMAAYHQCVEAMRAEIAVVRGSGVLPCGVPEFNDAPTTTREDVVLVAKRALVDLEDRGL